MPDTPMPDTIAAIATPPGYGGIGIIRLSGPKTTAIAHILLGQLPPPRFAIHATFHDHESSVIDQGLALFFPNPNSFTGEDVLELHGHGGPVVQDILLRRVIQLGARLARPGEFSERAFHNDKMDLTQAEAVADLIGAASEQAVRAAVQSLQGEFSKRIQQVVTAIIDLRTYIEAAIDFPEEEIDFLSDGKIQKQLSEILSELHAVFINARQGTLLRDGMTVVIAGRPNAGKSSLLNALSGRDAAIVTEVPGTTRDVLREAIQIDGLPLHIIDTAGLRESDNPIEQEGIRRARAEIEKADRILLVIDSATTTLLDQQRAEEELKKEFLDSKLLHDRLTVVRNKTDLTDKVPEISQEKSNVVITLSAKTGAGISLLRKHLKICMGFNANHEGNFIARRRHLDALTRAQQFLQNGQQQLENHHAGELLAEDLRAAHQALGEITGEFTSDDLLGKIFSSFCVGK